MAERTAADDLSEYDFSQAVAYHRGGFPPETLALARLIGPLGTARDALARYDQMLTTLHNGSLLLAPMRSQEAVVSSRIEGTVTTLDALLQYEAERDDDSSAGAPARDDTLETLLYARAMREAETKLREGWPISNALIREAHRTLLSSGRGQNQSPGEFKTEQNYIADRLRKRVLFVPIEPLHLNDGMERLQDYLRQPAPLDPLLRTAVFHAEFEALHPFNDGNGRIGRMLVTLMLWKDALLSGPNFFLSAYLEREKDQYIERLRQVSAADDWTSWCVFFFEAVASAARENLAAAQRISDLYQNLRDQFRGATGSQWHGAALDFMFERPVFTTTQFVRRMTVDHSMSAATARRFISELSARGILALVRPGAGQRPAMYALEPLLQVLRV